MPTARWRRIKKRLSWLWAANFLQQMQSLLLTGQLMKEEWRVNKHGGVALQSKAKLKSKADDAIKQKCALPACLSPPHAQHLCAHPCS